MKLIQHPRFALALIAALTTALSAQAASLVSVTSIEVWNGTNNPHSANGVTLSGSGTLASPYVYTIPAGMAIAAGGIIRLSTTVDGTNLADTNNITFTFTGGNLQMDSGAYIDVGSPARSVNSRFALNMGGGSITGAGTIIGIDHVRTTTGGLLSVQPRSVVISGALNVSLANFDVHTENTGTSVSPSPAINATGIVVVSGTINTSDIQAVGGNSAQSFSISAGFISVNNVDTRTARNDGATSSGAVTFKALNAAGGYSTSSGANAYTNQIVVKGNFTTAGVGTSGGNITLQSAVLRMDTGSTLAKQTNATLTAVVGVTNVSVPTNLLFMNISGTTGGPAGTPLSPTYTVTWDGAYANSAPTFLASPVVKPAGRVGVNYSLAAQTLAGSAVDYQWDTLTFAKVSGPAWLSVASNGGLSGTPTGGDAGINTWQVSVSDGSLSTTGTLQSLVGRLAIVTSAEVWNGSNNVHAADGVTLSGAGTATNPYLYTIPAGMRIASGGSIRLSASVDYGASSITDTNYITFQFAGSNLQVDSGGWIDVGHPNRSGISRFLCDLGGGSITGAGLILGIDHVRNAGSGVNIRYVTITNATAVSLANVDMHAENLNVSAPDLRIYATNGVSVTGTITTSYTVAGGDHGTSGNCFIYAGSITVSNMDTRSIKDTGFNNGNVTLVALNAAGGYSTSYAANAYTNQLVVKGAITTAGPSNIFSGNLTLQAVVLRLDTGSSLAKATNGVLTVVEGMTNVSVLASQLFMNVSGTLVGPSSQVLNATNTVTWNGTLAPPYFLTSPVMTSSARVGVAYGLSSQTLAGSAVDPQWGSMTFAMVSGPSWLSVASNGSLSGTPADGDAGTNTWLVSVSANSLSSTGTLQIIVGRLVSISAVEVWNGLNNPHAADGVTLTGFGTVIAPYVYTIPNGMSIAAGGSIRLSATVDWNASPVTDTNNITFMFSGGNLQMDSGAYIDVGSQGRNFNSAFALNLGGGSITGAGTIIGIDHTRTSGTGLGVQPRSVVINNALNVSLVNFDVHTENSGATVSPSPAINATGSVAVSGTITTSDIQTNGGNAAQSFSISAGSISVNNVDTHASRTNSGTSSGAVTFKALNAAGGYSTSYAANAYTNQIVVTGNFSTAGFGTSGGSITLQGVVLRMNPGSTLALQTNGTLTAAVGVTNVSVPAKDLFMNLSGTTVGPAGTALSPAFTVTWNGTPAAGSAPVFTSHTMTGAVATRNQAYSATLAGTATDADNNVLTYLKDTGASWLQIAADGTLSGTPTIAGTNSFAISVTDGTRYDSATLSIIVNDPPTFLTTPVVKPNGKVGVSYGAGGLTLATSATDLNSNPLTFASVSGPAWLSVAPNGSLSGTPASGDLGLNSWSVTVSDGMATVSGTLQITVVAAGTSLDITTMEDWDGIQNPRGGEGVTLSGSGTEADPATYTIPAIGLHIASTGVIRMSPTTSEDRSIGFRFTGGNLQLDNGAVINVARRTRDGRQIARFDLGGGSVTGAGQIAGLWGSSDTPRVIFITNAADVAMSTIDVHVENVSNSGRNMFITASNHVDIGTINNSDYDTGGSSAPSVTVQGGSVTVSNVFAYARRPSGAKGTTVSLQALGAPGFSAGNGAANSYANSLIVNGLIQVWTNGETNITVTLQAVKVQLGAAFNLIMPPVYSTTNLQAGAYPNGVGATAANMFVNNSALSALTPSYVVQWSTASTATAVTSSGNPTCPTSPVSFTATVTPPTAGTLTGTVQFKTNGVGFGSPVALSGSNATSGAILLPPGVTTVAATYSGNTTFSASTSPDFAQTVLTNTSPVLADLSMGALSATPSTLGILGGKHPPVDAEGDPLTLTVGTAAHGTTSTDGTNVTYTASADYVGTDSFSYTVTDGCSPAATATVAVTVMTNAGGFNLLSGPIANGDGTVTISYLGIPGYNYALDTATDLTLPIYWTPVITNTASSNGALSFTFSTAAGQGYFRTRYAP